VLARFGPELPANSLCCPRGPHSRTFRLIPAYVSPARCGSVPLLPSVVVNPARQVEPDNQIVRAALLRFVLSWESRGRGRGRRQAAKYRPQLSHQGQGWQKPAEEGYRHREPPLSGGYSAVDTFAIL
jgi:hypothetical protein